MQYKLERWLSELTRIGGLTGELLKEYRTTFTYINNDIWHCLLVVTAGDKNKSAFDYNTEFMSRIIDFNDNAAGLVTTPDWMRRFEPTWPQQPDATRVSESMCYLDEGRIFRLDVYVRESVADLVAKMGEFCEIQNVLFHEC